MMFSTIISLVIFSASPKFGFVRTGLVTKEITTKTFTCEEWTTPFQSVLVPSGLNGGMGDGWHIGPRAVSFERNRRFQGLLAGNLPEPSIQTNGELYFSKLNENFLLPIHPSDWTTGNRGIGTEINCRMGVEEKFIPTASTFWFEAYHMPGKSYIRHLFDGWPFSTPIGDWSDDVRMTGYDVLFPPYSKSPRPGYDETGGIGGPLSDLSFVRDAGTLFYRQWNISDIFTNYQPSSGYDFKFSSQIPALWESLRIGPIPKTTTDWNQFRTYDHDGYQRLNSTGRKDYYKYICGKSNIATYNRGDCSDAEFVVDSGIAKGFFLMGVNFAIFKRSYAFSEEIWDQDLISKYWSLKPYTRYVGYIIPQELKTAYLPISWFRSQEFLDGSGLSGPPWNLKIFEPFVASSEAIAAAYPEYSRTENASILAKGTQIFKLAYLETLTSEELKSLPLPWQTKQTTQDDFDSWAVKNYDWALGRAKDHDGDYPPMPPDYQNNITTMAFPECPDMFQYYALYKTCVDIQRQKDREDRPLEPTNFADVKSAIYSRLGELEGVVDYTAYRPNGSIDFTGTSDPPVGKQYSLKTLLRTNPTQRDNADLNDPNAEFFLRMGFARFKKIDPGSSVSCGEEDAMAKKGTEFFKSYGFDKDPQMTKDAILLFWYDHGFIINGGITGYATSRCWDRTGEWEEARIPINPQVKYYLNKMGALFQTLNRVRDITKFNGFGFGWNQTSDGLVSYFSLDNYLRPDDPNDLGKRFLKKDSWSHPYPYQLFNVPPNPYGYKPPDYSIQNVQGLIIDSYIQGASYELYKTAVEEDPLGGAGIKVYLGDVQNEGEKPRSLGSFLSGGVFEKLALGHAHWMDPPLGWNGRSDYRRYVHYILQNYPIVLEDAWGYKSTIGMTYIICPVLYDVNNDIWIGPNQKDVDHYLGSNGAINFNESDVGWDKPGNGNESVGFSTTTYTLENDTYDKRSANYLSDKLRPEERDELTWSQRLDAMGEIGKKIAVSEGLDFMMKLLYKNRATAYELVRRIGLERMADALAKYGRMVYRGYKEYRDVMDQAREVRDASKRLKNNYRQLTSAYKSIWQYYDTLNYSKLRPGNITRILPMNLVYRADFYMWALSSDLEKISKGSLALSKKFETQMEKAFPGSTSFHYRRAVQLRVANIAYANSSEGDEERMKSAQQAGKTKAGFDSTKAWKVSTIMENLSMNMSGSGIWLSNGYTQGVNQALMHVESDWKAWGKMKDHMIWQQNQLATMFTHNQGTEGKNAITKFAKQSSDILYTPYPFDPDSYFPVASSWKMGSQTVATCGKDALGRARSCFAK